MTHFCRPPRFTWQDQEQARREWGCNCGPAAIAAILGMTLDEVRPHLGDFERKRYTNPTLMFATLRSIGRLFLRLQPEMLGEVAGWREGDWPQHGLARIQWEGPWTGPGVPIRARYRHTHWVGASRYQGDLGIFDVNMLGNGSGWVSFGNWRHEVVPWLLRELVPGASGGWHVTHAIEFGVPA